MPVAKPFLLKSLGKNACGEAFFCPCKKSLGEKGSADALQSLLLLQKSLFLKRKASGKEGKEGKEWKEGKRSFWEKKEKKEKNGKKQLLVQLPRKKPWEKGQGPKRKIK